MHLSEQSTVSIPSKPTPPISCQWQPNESHPIGSRPQLIHTSSKQSIAASDYYSLASDDSNHHDHTPLQFQTPPSQIRSGAASPDIQTAEPATASIRPVRQSPPGPAKKPTVVRFSGTQADQSKASSAGFNSQRVVDNDISPTTPGVDDTPYIRFAIDQLTRDEELLGPRHHGAPSEEAYPVDRIIPDEGLGYYGHGRSSTRRERQPPNPTIRHTETIRELKYIRSIYLFLTMHLVPDDVFLPVDPPNDSFRYSKLDFVPRVLRPLPLVAFILCCLFMVAAIILSNVWSAQHNGLWRYDGVDTSRYFLFQFFPQFLAMLMILWLLIIQRAIQRILPFSVLSSEIVARQNSKIFDDVTLFPTNFLIPNIACFRYGEPVLGFCFVIFWLSLFTVPLHSAFFQTRFYTNDGLDVWRWTAVRPVGWTLLVLYILLIIALVLLMLRFLLRQTGLKWDPVSLADILVLFQRSNILSDFEGSEIPSTKDGQRISKTYRLGYWTTSNRSNEVFYAVGEDHALVRQYSLEGGKMKARLPATSYAGRDMDLEGQRPVKTTTLESLQTKIHSNLRYQWVPWFLKDTFVIAWIVTAIILLLAFIIVSFVNHAIQNGFLPLLPAPTTSQGFSPANFLYSFLPSLLGMILFLLWQPIDLYFRALQPFANLANTRGTTAEQSLLLDYSASLPIEISIKAAMAGHYKVAWISFVSLLSASIPTLAGGIFTAQFFVKTQDVRIAASLPAYIALVVFVVIYALSFLIISPARKRHLPHDISTLGQLVSFLYQSPLLDDAAFQQPRSKINLVTGLLSAPSGEKSSPQYAFGVFYGRDGGREHLGIDRLQRPGSGEMIVTTGIMAR